MIPASLVWRVLILAGLVFSAGAVALGPVLYLVGTEAIEKADNAAEQAKNAAQENRETLCAVGGFLTDAPLIRQEGVDREAFVGQLHVTRAFLRDLRKLDCPDDGFGAGVTIEAIERQLKSLHERLRRERAAVAREQTERPAGGDALQPPQTGGQQPGPPQGGPPGEPGPPGPPGPPEEPPGLLEPACELTETLLHLC